MLQSSVYRALQNEEKRSIAINLLRRGAAINIIAPAIGLAIEKPKQLQQQINKSAQHSRSAGASSSKLSTKGFLQSASLGLLYCAKMTNLNLN